MDITNYGLDCIIIIRRSCRIRNKFFKKVMIWQEDTQIESHLNKC